MQIIQAIDELKRVLGMACGGGGGADNRSEMGDSIMQSVTSIQEIEPRIRNFDSVVYSAVGGGEVTIVFSGNQQPEAARTLHSAIGTVLGTLDLDRGERRGIGDDGTGRIIKFTVPNDKAALFTDGVSQITQSLKDSQNLREQYGVGTSVSLELESIPSIKPFVNIVVSRGYEMVDQKPVITPPHFDLRLQGVPEELAKNLATILGTDPDGLEDSKSRTSRDLSKTLRGGKDITIDLSKPESDIAIEAIRTFIQRIGNLPELGSGSGRFGGGG
jgi:hypothetical protein